MRRIQFSLLLVLVLILTSCGTGNSGQTSMSVAQGIDTKLEEEVEAIAWPYYEKSLDVTANSPEGRYYTDHKSAHATMVCEKSLEVGDAIREAVTAGGMGGDAQKGRVALSGDIDREMLEGAALCHDIGMSGSGYATTPVLDKDGEVVTDKNGRTVYEMDEQGHFVMHAEDNDNFNEIRTNHSMNSGLYVLVNRQGLRDAGYSDEQIDAMAVACMAHSKSNSGVRDLNSLKDWVTCFDRLDSLVLAWNRDHADETISFDRSPFEKSSDKLGALASETLALRVGDVSRDSGPDAEAQSGEKVHVDRSTVDDHGGTIAREVKDAKVIIGEQGDLMDDEKNKQVHIGEQNIRENHTFVNDAGDLTHEIQVSDGCSAPRCTQQAVDDHLGEFYSARDEHFDVNVLFDHFDASDKDFFEDSWEDFRTQAAQDYTNITIHYPWDQEAAQ